MTDMMMAGPGFRYEVFDQNGDVLWSSESWSLAHARLRDWQAGDASLGGIREVRPCEKCKGNGETVRRHPRWGSPTCPSPTIEKTCRQCGGTGLEYSPAKKEIDDGLG